MTNTYLQCIFRKSVSEFLFFKNYLPAINILEFYIFLESLRLLKKEYFLA